MADVELLPCPECGMPCRAGEYHPFAACLMFKACRNSETVRANLAPLQAEIEALRAEVERLRTDGASAVRWALGSAYWSEVLEELFGSGARKGIDVLETRWRKALERAERLEEALRELVAVFRESGMYDEEVFAKARAALEQENSND